MKIKSYFIVLFLTVTYSVSFAQEYKQEKDLVESIIGKAKKDFVTETVEISNEHNQKFWKLYNEYESHRTGLAEKRVGLISKYVANFEASNPRQEKYFMDDVFKLRRKEERNIKKYYNKLEHAVGTKTAMQFFQVEEYLRSAVDHEIYNQLPLKM